MPPASPHAATPSPALRRLGELLVERHLATPADIGKALAFQQQFGGRIGSILVRLGALSEESLLPVLSEQLGIPLLDSSEWPVDAQAARVPLEASGIVADWWVDNDVIAWAAPDGQLLVAGRDPLDPMVNELLGQRLPAGWSWRLARAQDIERLVDLLARARRAPGDCAVLEHAQEGRGTGDRGVMKNLRHRPDRGAGAGTCVRAMGGFQTKAVPNTNPKLRSN